MKKMRKSQFSALLIGVLLLAGALIFASPASAAKIKLNKTKVELAEGKTCTLKVSGTKSKVKWSSANKKVATVSSKGKVTAKQKGISKITAKVGSKKLTCKVFVLSKRAAAVKKFRAYVLSKGKANEDESRTLTIIEETDGEGGERKISVTVRPDSWRMLFDLESSGVEPPYAAAGHMQFNLLECERGWFQNFYDDGYGEEEWYSTDSIVDTEFYKATKTGLRVIDWHSGSICDDEGEETNVFTQEQIIERTFDDFSYCLQQWNRLAKKAGTSIGAMGLRP